MCFGDAFDVSEVLNLIWRQLWIAFLSPVEAIFCRVLYRITFRQRRIRGLILIYLEYISADFRAFFVEKAFHRTRFRLRRCKFCTLLLIMFWTAVVCSSLSLQLEFWTSLDNAEDWRCTRLSALLLVQKDFSEMSLRSLHMYRSVWVSEAKTMLSDDNKERKKSF